MQYGFKFLVKWIWGMIPHMLRRIFVHQNCHQDFMSSFSSVTYICPWIPIFRLHANTACRRRCSIGGAHPRKTASYRKDLFQSTLNAWECMQSFLMTYHKKLKENVIFVLKISTGRLFETMRTYGNLLPPLSLFRQKIKLVLVGRIVSS